MCKTIQDSVLSGTLSYLTGAVLIATGKPKYIWLGTFLLIIGTMQWVDTVIWTLKHRGMPTVEFSRYAVISILVLQPLVGYLGYVYYSGHRLPLYEIAYALAAPYIVYSWIKDCKETTITADGYLKWCDITYKSLLNKTIFFALLAAPFLYFPDRFISITMMIGALFLWLNNINHEAFGSRWCHSFNFLDTIVLAKVGIESL
jgi:hypothetical protein